MSLQDVKPHKASLYYDVERCIPMRLPPGQFPMYPTRVTPLLPLPASGWPGTPTAHPTLATTDVRSRFERTLR